MYNLYHSRIFTNCMEMYFAHYLFIASKYRFIIRGKLFFFFYYSCVLAFHRFTILFLTAYLFASDFECTPTKV